MDIMFSLSETCSDSAITGLEKEKKKSTLSRLLVNYTPVIANFFFFYFLNNTKYIKYNTIYAESQKSQTFIVMK